MADELKPNNLFEALNAGRFKIPQITLPASLLKPSAPAGPEWSATAKPIPYFGYLPVTAELLQYAVVGFEIPSLPALPQERTEALADLVQQVLYRFQLFLLDLHQPGTRRAVALQFMADPERAALGSRVLIYVLCRSAHEDLPSAISDATAFARHAAQAIPRNGHFNYGQPVFLGKQELEHVTFQVGGLPWPDLEIVELRKHEERQTCYQQPALHYVPHRFWADRRVDPWLLLIESLAAVKQPTAIRVELSPVRLDAGSGLDLVASAGQWFALVGEDLDRRASQGEQSRPDMPITNEGLRAGEVAAAQASAANVSYVQRGRHVYKQLISNADRLFGMRVVLASRNTVPESLVGGVRTSLCSLATDDPVGALGWYRPDVVRPAPNEMQSALENLNFLAQARWGGTAMNQALGPKINLRYVVTPEEAVSLFHLPVFEQAGETSALSTAETPFVIPPESLDNKRIRSGEKAIRIGYLYQREKLLSPDSQGKNGNPFCVSMSDLIKPSLLVGAPGSGKSNLAVSLLIQLWRDHRVPFLVLDPSTGQEYRLLLGEPSLKEDLIVYTAGDPEGLPLQFNPFAVPPGVTIRNHTTRIMAAFGAAFSMFDPVPAIYEGALERLYTVEKYCGPGRVMKMEDKGNMSGAWPTLSDFALALQDEVSEKAVNLYQGSAESIGIIRGASTIRINAIGKKLGYMLNVPRDDGSFFQKLLSRPVVIELGTLGDTANIALLMAFLVSQLTGYVEYASRQMALQGKRREHMLLIEEAHRLLAGGNEGGPAAKSAEDLNIMLAEVRKFGQGIMILDQRPSSLVGGVLDNSYVKILTRLSDRAGFERLSDDLNLTQAQQRFARTRLKAGDAILLDRDAGQPVLVRAENIKDGLEKQRLAEDLERKQIGENAGRHELTPPEAKPYVEPPLPNTSKKTENETKTASASSLSVSEKVRNWVVAQFESAVADLILQERNNGKLYNDALSKLRLREPDIEGAKAAVDAAISPDRPVFDALAAELWEKFKWAMLSLVAEERASAHEIPEEIAERIRELRSQAKALTPVTSLPAASENAALASAPIPVPVAGVAAGNGSGASTPAPQKPLVTGAQRWLKPEIDRLFDDLAALLKQVREKGALYHAIKAKVLQAPADINGAFVDAASEIENDHGKFDAYTRDLWEKMKWLLVGMIAEDQKAIDVVREVRARKNEKASVTEAAGK